MLMLSQRRFELFFVFLSSSLGCPKKLNFGMSLILLVFIGQISHQNSFQHYRRNSDTHLAHLYTLLNMPNMAKYAKCGISCACLDGWTRLIWSSRVSLERSCEIQFRRVNPKSVGPLSQKLRPNKLFGPFPHCNYNVKLKNGVRMSFMGP